MMKGLLRLKRVCVGCVLLTMLLGALPAASAHAGETRISAEFLTQLQKAVNRGDVDALRGMVASASKPDLSWVTQSASLLGERSAWQVKALDIPGAPALVAFTKYHPCESAGDHLFRITLTPDGPRLSSEIPETDTGGVRIRDHKLVVRFDVPHHHAYITDRVSIEAPSPEFPALLLRINTIYKITSVKRRGIAVPFRQAGGFLALLAPGADHDAYDLAYDAPINISAEDYILSDQAGLTSYWYPHTARLPATSEVRITVPKGWTAIGQGESLGKSVQGRQTTFAWRNSLPVCYLTIAAGRYTVTTRRFGSVAVSSYLLEHDSARARLAIETAGGAIRWFSRNFSPFPYSRYAVVETDVFPAALECYSFTLVGRRMLPMSIVHEVSHTWWGGIVPNTYTRTMWNESFAEYSDGLYHRKTGAPSLQEFTTQFASGMLFQSSTLMTARDAMNAGDAMVGYGKGSLVLETLEKLLGTPTMLACMRRFIARHRSDRSGEAAEWQEFIDAVTQTAGSKWAAFFPPWLERTELPDLHLEQVRADREGGMYRVTGRIVQKTPAYWLKVPLVVETSTGASVQQQIAVEAKETSFQITTSAKPVQLALDPKREALRAGAKRTEPPSLMSMHILNGPLLVVYATGGSPAENAAVESVARTQMQSLFPFATLKVQADHDTTASDLSASSVLLVGRTEHLHLPIDWSDRLPLRYTDGEISLEGKRWQGNDLWGLAIVEHPVRPDALLAQTAGTGPEAIRNFMYQGDLDGQKGLFVVRSPGKSIVSRSAVLADPTVVSLTP